MTRRTKVNLSLLVFAVLFSFNYQAFGLTINYEYDDLHRLKKVIRSDGKTAEYLFDELGNRMAMTVSSASLPSGNDLNLTSANAYVTTIAGTAGTSGATDGIGSVARFDSPIGITTDGINLYVADQNNHLIRKIVIATGQVTTLAGSAGMIGHDDGIGSAARFNYPSGITTDGTNLYVADKNNHMVRKIVIASGEVMTLAGSNTRGGSDDGVGSAARFNSPFDITMDETNLYVADAGNHNIRKIVITTGQVTTLSGSAYNSGNADGTGTSARFNMPNGITTDGVNLYVADTGNSTIRKIIIASGEVTTLAGSGERRGSTDGIGSAARFNSPFGITTGGINLYVSDNENQNIREIVITMGEVTTLAGPTGSLVGTWGAEDGVGTAARFIDPRGITTDGTNLYIAESSNTIRKISSVPPGPAITSASSTTTDGSYTVGSKISITLNFSEAISSTGLTIILNSGGSLTTGALDNVTNWSGVYTVALGQTTSDLSISSIIGTITDAASNSTINPTIPLGHNIGDIKSIVIPLNGSCGSSNGGSFISSPTSNLCIVTNTQPSVTGSGPWSWNCTGSNGGSTASCSASLKTKTIIQVPYYESFSNDSGFYSKEDYLGTAGSLMHERDGGEDQQGAIYLDNSSANAEDWHVQIRNAGIALENGKVYRLSVWLKAENQEKIIVSIGQQDDLDNNGHWENFGLYAQAAVDNQWRQYIFVFNAINNPETQPENVKLSFYLGKIIGKLWLDEVSLTINEISPIPYHEGFNDGIGGFTKEDHEYAAGEVQFQPNQGVNGSHCIMLSNSQIMNNAYQVQLKKIGFDIEDGKAYSVSFWLRSENPGTFRVALTQEDDIDGDGEWSGFGLYKEDQAQTSWKRYSYNFKALKHPENEKQNVRFGVYLGLLQGKVWLDEVDIIEDHRGDVDGNGNVDLADAILVLRMTARLPTIPANKGADVNSDNKISLPEAIYIIQKVAHMR
jgi:hypothetical protein